MTAYPPRTADVAVIGAGLVGLATAHRLLERHPGLRVVVIEKEAGVAQHQSGRNSGVLHSGVYYAPGSAKAANCRAGAAQMAAFCEAEGLPLRRCGKVIVAGKEEDLPRLAEIERRGRANGVVVEMLDFAALRAVEPFAAGLAALWVPEAGVVDYSAVADRLATRVRERGGVIAFGASVRRVQGLRAALLLGTTAGAVEAAWVVNAAGLHADRIAALCGEKPAVRIVPFRGEYYALRPGAEHLCRGLIYPVPDPRFPFLGVHFSRRIGGGVEVGPSAVLAAAREGYRLGQVSLRDFLETVRYRGFRRLARRHAAFGVAELARAASRGLYVRAAQRLVPALAAADLRAAPSGVRAQAVTPEGRLLDDFLFQDGERAVHVLSAASPAATACLNIGRVVAERLEARWG